MSNVDPEEIAKFDNAAHWWDRAGPLRTLHHINPARMTFIEKHTPLKGQQVLDVGCGGGILTESLGDRAEKVLGIDLSPQAIAAAKAHLQAENINYACQAIEDTDGEYDIITCMELLEHVPCPSAMIQAVAKRVKPGGYAYFSTLNRSLAAYLLAIVGAEYILGLLPRGTHDYQQFIKPSELRSWCSEAGLALQSMAGLQYNPMTKNAWLNENLSVNYLVLTQKL